MRCRPRIVLAKERKQASLPRARRVFEQRFCDTAQAGLRLSDISKRRHQRDERVHRGSRGIGDLANLVEVRVDRRTDDDLAKYAERQGTHASSDVDNLTRPPRVAGLTRPLDDDRRAALEPLTSKHRLDRAATRRVPITLRRQEPFAQETLGPPICAALLKRRRARSEDGSGIVRAIHQDRRLAREREPDEVSPRCQRPQKAKRIGLLAPDRPE